MPRAISIAVAGLGRIGWQQHCRSLAAHKDFTLAAVSDPEPDRRAEAEREKKCAAYARYDEMIAHPGLQAVVIATPTHLHKDMALAAFRRGLHVLLEKPMAMDLAESRTIARAAARAGRVLTVFQPRRLSADFQHLLKIVRSGRIGPVVRVQAGLFSYSRRNDWQSLRKFGGGMLYNYGAHSLDQVLQLIGYDVSRIFCHLQLVASAGDAEDVVKIVVQTRGGVLGDIDISQASTIKPYELMVWGTCGAVQLQNHALHLRYFDPKSLPPRKVNAHLASAGRKYCNEPIEYVEETVTPDPTCAIDVYADLARAIRKGAAPAVRPEETLALMKVLEKCRADAGRIARMPAQ